jgi:hypothetical protein
MHTVLSHMIYAEWISESCRLYLILVIIAMSFNTYRSCSFNWLFIINAFDLTGLKRALIHIYLLLLGIQCEYGIPCGTKYVFFLEFQICGAVV